MANARIVFDSADLVRLIYSFGDPEHRRLTKIISNKIQTDTREFTDNFIIRRSKVSEKDRMMFTFYDYMEELPKSILVDRLKIYKRCYCCQRHNHRKPIIHEGQLVVFKGVVTESNPAEMCMCECRHHSRFIINHLFA